MSGRKAVTLGVMGVTAAWSGRHATADTVRRWHPSQVPTIRAGGLSVRVLGHGVPATVLLHGLAGCGAYYSSRYDDLAVGRRVVAPDLLGYGDSYRTASPSGWGLKGQLDALDGMAAELGLSGPLTVVGHSLGASLALHWAARHAAQIERVVSFSAPLYLSRAEGLTHVQDLGPLEKLMAADNHLAQLTCGWMCRHRTTASWLAAAITPDRPMYLARRGVLHTWPAYEASMNEIVLNDTWQGALATLAEHDVPVLLAEGDRDPIPVRGRATALAAQYPSVTALSRPGVGHELPLAEPDWCAQLCEARSSTPSRTSVTTAMALRR